MKKYWPVAVLFVITIAVISCGPSLKVNSDYDKSVNFSQYKTFSLYKSDNSASAISQLNHDRIINAIKSEMTKKGFQENDENPDVLVNMVTILQDRVSVNASTNYYGYGGMYRPYYGGVGMASSNTSYNTQYYKDGSLIIDVIDASTKKLVWQGTGNKEIDEPIKDPDKKIPQAISSIMASFPPGMTKKS